MARSARASNARRACGARFLASLLSLAFRFQPRSRPFVWLLVRRKVTRGWKIPPRLASPCGTTILPGARVFRSLNYPGQGKWGATPNCYSRYVMVLATAVSASGVYVSCDDAVTSRSLTWFIQNFFFFFGGGGGTRTFQGLLFPVLWHRMTWSESFKFVRGGGGLLIAVPSPRKARFLGYFK